MHDLEKKQWGETILSVMHVNNEIGTILGYRKISEICIKA